MENKVFFTSKGLTYRNPHKLWEGVLENGAIIERFRWKELVSATLCLITLNYIERKNSNPPRALVKALNSLKTRNDIAITKSDKSPGVVVMDRFEYICLLGDASVDNTTKFILVNDKPPKSRGWLPRYFSLLQKEETCTLLHEILPNEITEKLPRYSSNSHTYRAYATGTYNHKLAKWLEK